MYKLLEQKIDQYGPANALEQEHVLQEIIQQLILSSLARAGFFREAIFQGGTALRLLWATRRFSEDLDFLLKQPDRDFAWRPHLERVLADCAADGLQLELTDRSAVTGTIRKVFLKTDSIGKELTVRLPFVRDGRKKLRIKLEIDVNPPAGSELETRYLSFPTLTAITTQTLSSGFATKIHALLCRSYAKGRDWYDFLWYVARKVSPKARLLANALQQVGPWAGRQPEVDADWLLSALSERIATLDWQRVRADALRFVAPDEQGSVEAWGAPLFDHHLELMRDYLS